MALSTRKNLEHKSTLVAQAAWVLLVIVSAWIAFAWGAKAWQGLMVWAFDGMALPVSCERDGARVIGCFFMGIFGFLTFLFYPVGALLLYRAFQRGIRVEGNFESRIYVLWGLVFCISAARLTGAYWSAAIA